MMTSILIRVCPVLIVAFLLSYLLTPLFRKLAIRFSVYDMPSDRKIHRKQTPLLGGLALYFAILLSLLAHLSFGPLLYTLVGGLTAITFLGFLDDIRSIRPWVKLFAQIIVAFLTWYFGVSINFVSNPFGEGIFYLGSLAAPVTVLWIVGTINTMNLIDGLDGLAAGIAGIAALFLCVMSMMSGQWVAIVLSGAVCGSCLGFLRYNFFPARIFMGDSGAMLLGYLLGVISILGVFKGTVALSVVIPILVLGIPISDTLYAIVRRIKGKKRIFLPDTEHIHHRMVDLGLSQKTTALIIYFFCTLLGILALVLSVTSGTKALFLLAIIATVLMSLILFFKRKPQRLLAYLRKQEI